MPDLAHVSRLLADAHRLLGATLTEVRPDSLRLLGRTLLYFAAAVALAHLRTNRRSIDAQTV